MTTEPTKETQEPNTDATPQPSEAPAPSFKDDPKYQAMSKQLAEYQRAETERADADALAEREAAEKKLRDEGKFDELATNHASELAAMKSLHEKTLLEMSLKTELIKTGFSNDMFVNGAISAFSGANDEIAAYVETLKGDEANKAFLAGSDNRTVHTPPSATPSGGGSPNWEQVKADLDSPDRQTRITARAKVTAHREQTGNYPFES